MESGVSLGSTMKDIRPKARQVKSSEHSRELFQGYEAKKELRSSAMERCLRVKIVMTMQRCRRLVSTIETIIYIVK